MPKTNDTLLKRAKAMRKEMTEPEMRLWFALRAKRFENVKFSRQVVTDHYVPDFCARSRRLVIEVDGDTHAGDERRDAKRTAWSNSKAIA